MNLTLLRYFLYLRDVSHKIAVTADWGKCLKQKPNRNNKPVIQTNWDDAVYDFKANGKMSALKEINKYLNSYADKEAFLGIGSIYGTFNRKQMLGSIINIPIKYNINELSGNIEDLVFDYENIMLNHQLILTFFEFNDTDMLEIFRPLLLKIKDFFIKNYKNTPDNLLNNFIILKDDIENTICEFLKSKEIFINKEITKISLLEKNNKIKEDPVISFNDIYVFAFEVPSGISTWKYLDDFCAEIKENETISSDVLNSILSGDDRVVNDSDFDNDMFKLIPISLSENQKESIKHALTDNVSYVQGPPGTGKSHTITALALISLLLNKKTLIVSQKPTALQVIKSKLDECFKSLIEKDFVPYIYFDKNNKRFLKNSLEKFISKNKKISYDDIEKLHEELVSFHNKLADDLEEKNKIQESIDMELNQQHQFSKLNNTYINQANNVDKEIQYKKDLKIKMLESENENFIKEVENIEKFYNDKKVLNKFFNVKLKKLNSEFNKRFESNINFHNLLKDGILKIYIGKILDLSILLFNITYIQKNLMSKTKFALLNKEKHNLNKEVDKIVNKYYYDSVEYNILLNFYEYNQQRKRTENDFENFTKMLHFQKPDIILEKLKDINFNNLLNVFNLWLSEIRYIGEILPNEKEMFDLIIIDEASQVNIAEIFPVLYRGKSVCIVGDEKQLGLSSVGLNFMIGNKEEQHIWDKYLGTELSYENAELRDILVTKSSILEMITSKMSNKNYSKVMLDEHFRSMPHLANFTNKKFYNDELKIMTETPEKAMVNCFQSFQVEGKKDRKRNIEEAQKVVEIVQHIHNVKSFSDIKISPYQKDKSIGIISLLREQVECIKEELLKKNNGLNLTEENDYFLFNDARIKCGTPEELQGDEFDYVIISATVDGDTRNHGHYNNDNRLNVATSRAKYFTYFIYSDVARIPFFASYLRYFGLIVETEIQEHELIGWTYSEHKFDSLFEEYIAGVLKNIIAQFPEQKWKLFNQVEFAKKRIDFVIYNEINQRYVAIEVDGQFHFKNSSSRLYSDEHNERVELLTRAGWNIIHTPYYAWYLDGFIDEKNQYVIEEKNRLKNEIYKSLNG